MDKLSTRILQEDTHCLYKSPMRKELKRRLFVGNRIFVSSRRLNPCKVAGWASLLFLPFIDKIHFASSDEQELHLPCGNTDSICDLEFLDTEDYASG